MYFFFNFPKERFFVDADSGVLRPEKQKYLELVFEHAMVYADLLEGGLTRPRAADLSHRAQLGSLPQVQEEPPPRASVFLEAGHQLRAEVLPQAPRLLAHAAPAGAAREGEDPPQGLSPEVLCEVHRENRGDSEAPAQGNGDLRRASAAQRARGVHSERVVRGALQPEKTARDQAGAALRRPEGRLLGLKPLLHQPGWADQAGFCAISGTRCACISWTSSRTTT